MPEQDVEALLDQLQRESVERRAELRALGAQLPEATSRRSMVRAMFGSIAAAPDKPKVAKRVIFKILRTPVDMVRRVLGR